ACGLQLPEDWRDRVPTDPSAPMVSLWAGYSKLLWARTRRDAGQDPSERLHPSVAARQQDTPKYRPKAKWKDELLTRPGRSVA
ncbi:MAG: hypothetical protein AAF679_09775, partial [Pseudomonadota bacterium]